LYIVKGGAHCCSCSGVSLPDHLATQSSVSTGPRSDNDAAHCGLVLCCRATSVPV
jgi:hypothetical protein